MWNIRQMTIRSRHGAFSPISGVFTVSAVCIACALLPGLGGCVSDDDGGGGGGGGVSQVACETLDSGVGPALHFWPAGDTYGVNSFYVWELDDASTPDGEEYYFHGTGAPVLDRVPLKDWQIPPTLWSAMRLQLDGFDPHMFSADDPFYLWYLPNVGGVSWQSQTGARNDGNCPDNNYMINGRARCIGMNQLDPAAPNLRAGGVYLVRMLMLVPLGGEQNRIQSCYQKIVKN